MRNGPWIVDASGIPTARSLIDADHLSALARALKGAVTYTYMMQPHSGINVGIGAIGVLKTGFHLYDGALLTRLFSGEIREVGKCAVFSALHVLSAHVRHGVRTISKRERSVHRL